MFGFWRSEIAYERRRRVDFERVRPREELRIEEELSDRLDRGTEEEEEEKRKSLVRGLGHGRKKNRRCRGVENSRRVEGEWRVPVETRKG
ncbi:hypothetical protein U1Q18_024943 [Sarracenia purpurea var. burkii]